MIGANGPAGLDDWIGWITAVPSCRKKKKKVRRLYNIVI
jgi:hypothetical protein